MDNEFVWVFARPDSETVAMIPAASEGDKPEKLWWTVMMLLLQIYAGT